MNKSHDYSQYTNEELAKIAGINLPNKKEDIYSKYSDDELKKIASGDKVNDPEEITFTSLAKSLPRAALQSGLNYGPNLLNIPHEIGSFANELNIPGLKELNRIPRLEPYRLPGEQSPSEKMDEHLLNIASMAGTGIKGAIGLGKYAVGKIPTASKLASEFVKDLKAEASTSQISKEYNAFHDIVKNSGYHNKVSRGSLDELMTGIKPGKRIEQNSFNPEYVLDKKPSSTVSELLGEFQKNPSYETAFKLQSELGKEAAGVRFSDPVRYFDLSKQRNNLKNDIRESFLKNGNPELAKKYDELSNSYFEKMEKKTLLDHLEKGGAIKKTGKGYYDFKVNPDRLISRFESIKNPKTADAAKPEHWDFYNKLMEKRAFEKKFKLTPYRAGMGGLALMGLGDAARRIKDLF